MVGLTNYNFEYIILAAERQGATELSWSGFYTSVPNWDVNKLRPDDWLYIKMTESKRIVYRPIQPFDLSLDPVSRYVTFTDYEPADKRSKYKSLRTLKEIQPGAWPTAPSPDETLIATQLDVAAIARAAEESETGRRLLSRTTAPSPKNGGGGNGASDPDAKSADPVTVTPTATATPISTAASTSTPAGETVVTFSKSEMEAAIKKQLETTLVDLIKKPDEVTTATVAATVTTATPLEEKRKKGLGKQPKKERMLPAKPMNEEALALMRREIRSEVQKEFEAKEETKRRQLFQQQSQQAQQQQQQSQSKQQLRDANYGYRMRSYRRSRSKSRSQTPPSEKRSSQNSNKKNGKRSHSHRSRSRSRSRSRETNKKESGSLSEPTTAEAVESRAVELVRLGLEQLTQSQRASSSGEDKKQQSEKSLEQRERQLQLQQQQLEQQQQMLSLQQQQQQLQKQQQQLIVQKSRRPAHSTFHLPGPEPAVFLPYPRSRSIGQLSSRPPLPKRQTLEEGFDGQWRESSSPDVTPERFHKASGGGQGGFQNQHQLWLQFQRHQQQQESDMEIGGISRLKRS